MISYISKLFSDIVDRYLELPDDVRLSIIVIITITTITLLTFIAIYRK